MIGREAWCAAYGVRLQRVGHAAEQLNNQILTSHHLTVKTLQGLKQAWKLLLDLRYFIYLLELRNFFPQNFKLILYLGVAA